jgi:phenylpyruvate tautomerase PptA (4-oxalocrotonate tautomerase family)
MPFLNIKTNVEIPQNSRESLLKKASQTVAQALHKPEQYVMVGAETGLAIMFAGSTSPAAFAELRALGLPLNKTTELSRLICDFLHSELKIPRDRIFINFADVAGSQWGWNGQTF